ncbi:MAG: acyl-ACP--UDP-N-acetylglucosamine O-acyltransferase [Planctomycetes bacterium]|nr:acyl-ACP--UDP-N-acetylglucosamine O-acyltransferase [Planctomycetota bacterium]
MANYSIHPTAFVSKECELGDGVEIGPFCVLAGRVQLGAGVRLVASVHITGPARIGAGTTLYPGVCIGFPPQDYKFKLGDVTAGVTIGENCLLREHVTVHAATKTDTPTQIGNNVMMMATSHAGHDARVGNNVILANSCLLAGHSLVQDSAILSGNSAVHQFTRIGRMAFISGLCGTSCDVPPFCVLGSRNVIHTVNLVGLRRSGVPRDEVTAVRNAFWHVLRKTLTKPDMIAQLEARGKHSPLVAEMARFVAEAKRPIARGPSHHDEEQEFDA